MALEQDLLRVIDRFPKEFGPFDVYRFLPELVKANPRLRAVRTEVRAALGKLVDRGRIEEVEPNWYRRLYDPGPTLVDDLGLDLGDFTTRAELGQILGLKSGDALRRGMFSPASGRYRQHLLLFHDERNNPYGDVVEPGRISYVGQGKSGDQEFTSFNRMLRDHLDLGIKVHFFTQPKDRPGKVRYEGEVVVEDAQRVYREEERRSVLQFQLVPVAEREESTAVRYGETVAHILQDNRPPGYENRQRVTSLYNRILRDTAFRFTVLQAYQEQCAVCGEPIRRDETHELQAAHIVAVAERGRDVVPNGLSLCVRHHWAFDHGVWTLTDDHKVVWLLDEPDPHDEVVAGERIRLPGEADLMPHPWYVERHRVKWASPSQRS